MLYKSREKPIITWVARFLLKKLQKALTTRAFLGFASGLRRGSKPLTTKSLINYKSSSTNKRLFSATLYSKN